MSGCGAIGSALALGARGCQFESGHPDHFLKANLLTIIHDFLFLFTKSKIHLIAIERSLAAIVILTLAKDNGYVIYTYLYY